MKKRNHPYERPLRFALGQEEEREALSFARQFMGKSPEQIHVFGLTGDSGAQRWLSYGCPVVVRLEAPDSLLRLYCKRRGLEFMPPTECDGVTMLRGNYWDDSGLEHIRRTRFNMFDADSESGPQIQLRMLRPAIKSAMTRGHALVVRNNMTGAARGPIASKTWWAASNVDERRRFVQEYKYLLPMSINMQDKVKVNAAAFFIKVAQYAEQHGGETTLHSQGFYKPEQVGRPASPTVMCPSIFGVKPR